MDATTSPSVHPTGALRLTPLDYALLALVCLILYGATLPLGRTLSCHETVHCQNVREMLASHDWLIPTYGGRPWLERPPLPHWLTALAALPFSPQDQVWPFHLGSLLAGMASVLLTAWMASVWFGRGVGWLSGLSLATMLEFYRYSIFTECDIYLCLVVTGALALFVKLEFLRRPADPGESVSFFGRRPWLVLAFFVLAGMTNAAKGLFFGALFVALPAAGYILLNWNWTALRRYLWLWGWLGFGLAAVAWPLAAYLRYPDIVDLWKSDYVGRMNQGYMKEPPWYYLQALPMITAPWILLCLAGLALTGRLAWKKDTPQRFLWCWALIPMAFFSLPQGKHHHYLLHATAPWAVFAGIATQRLWGWLTARPGWFKHPLTGAILLGVPGVIGLYVFRRKIPGGDIMLPWMLLGLPCLLAAAWWAFTQPRPRLALGALAGLLVAGYLGMFTVREGVYQPYGEDVAFMHRVGLHTQGENKIFVACDPHPLNGSWLLFYMERPTHFLHNMTFLRDAAIPREPIYLVGRANLHKELSDYGQAEVIDQSVYTRGEQAPHERFTLFRVRLRDDLERLPASKARITPMQATGRALGPYLQ